MAGTQSPRSLTVKTNWLDEYPDAPVNELLAQYAGPQSPFGDDVSFPLPVEELFYVHPGREDRPNLAGD